MESRVLKGISTRLLDAWEAAGRRGNCAIGFFFFFFCCANVFSDIEKAFSGCAGVCPFRDRLSEDRLLINLEEKILVKFNFSLLYYVDLSFEKLSYKRITDEL